MPPASRPPVLAVVLQHLGDAAVLRTTRSVLVRAPHVRLHHLRRLDDRLAAHLDGLSTAGPFGWQQCQAALANPGPGEMFTAAVRAIEDKLAAGLDQLIALADAVPALQPALASAFGWVGASSLRGLTQPLLNAPEPSRRRLGLAACALHQVDPGAALGAALSHADPLLRADGLRLAGRLGRKDLLPLCLDKLGDEDPACRLHAARAALRLGDRRASLEALQALAAAPSPQQAEALLALLRLAPADQARALLQPLSQDPAAIRLLIRGIGTAGDPHYGPWLIRQMNDLKLARLAGESFSLITGLDLAALDLERKPPEGLEAGPSDDPADADVALDEDESLPWPDPQKIAAWWQAEGQRLRPGARSFMGQPPSAAHCGAVLKTGFQRQRAAAADYLALLQPGTPVFNIAAPAARQLAMLGG